MRMFFVCFFFTFFLCSTFCLSSVLIFHTCWPGAAAGDDAGPGGGKSPYRGGGEGGGGVGGVYTNRLQRAVNATLRWQRLYQQLRLSLGEFTRTTGCIHRLPAGPGPGPGPGARLLSADLSSGGVSSAAGGSQSGLSTSQVRFMFYNLT